MSSDELQERWKYLYHEYLPALATARDSAQKHWPVHLDHCFARIVLDNVIGIDKPWTEVVKSPAIKNMSGAQLKNAIELAEQVANGAADLVALDERSLELRGKNKKRKASERDAPNLGSKKRKQDGPIISSYFLPSPTASDKKFVDAATSGSDGTVESVKQETSSPDMVIQFKRIADSDITAFRKQTLSLLCQIPRGRYSTYGAMSDWISQNSHKTCARAVGNAMRNNPFAPEVPCHRVLAGDGSLGGFKGSWGEEGKYAKQKHELLREEGVRFDSQGKVKGPPFRDFT